MENSPTPQQPTQQEIAGLAQQFMSRVNLTGQEVPAFSHVMRWLESFAADQPPAVD